jgi:hypothetical protein
MMGFSSSTKDYGAGKLLAPALHRIGGRED